MNAVRVVGILLIVAGLLGLVYGGFGYSKDNHQATLGSLELSVKDIKTVNIPIWLGVGSIACGSVFLLFGKK